MIFDILTLFPSMFQGAFSDSIIKRAVDNGIISIDFHNIRDHSDDTKHKTVDDYPYGGDAGMLMKVTPLVKCIGDAKERLAKHNPVVVYMSPQGELLNHKVVESFINVKSAKNDQRLYINKTLNHLMIEQLSLRRHIDHHRIMFRKPLLCITYTLN